jgi:hypothetical protein
MTSLDPAEATQKHELHSERTRYWIHLVSAGPLRFIITPHTSHAQSPAVSVYLLRQNTTDNSHIWIKVVITSYATSYCFTYMICSKCVAPASSRCRFVPHRNDKRWRPRANMVKTKQLQRDLRTDEEFSELQRAKCLEQLVTVFKTTHSVYVLLQPVFSPTRRQN